MNIVINYDFINAVKDVNENFTLKKIARNNKVRWVKFELPFFFALDYLVYRGDLRSTGIMLGIQFGVINSIEFIGYNALKRDIYKTEAEYRLKRLIPTLKEANLDTSYDLIKKSEMYDKKYEVRLNENKIPQIIQSKYILVPTYNYLGDVKQTSVLQKHVMGSNNYVLSLGSPKKVLKPVFSNV